MATITDRSAIDEIISNNGDNEDGVRALDVMKIVEYKNDGRIMWGITFRTELTMPGMPDRYLADNPPYVTDGHVIWTRKEAQ